MSFFFSLLWMGGWVPAYRHGRRNGHNVLSSIIDALAWPADLGWELADAFCATEKG